MEELQTRWVTHIQEIHVEAQILGSVGHIFRLGHRADVPGRAVKGILKWSNPLDDGPYRLFGLGDFVDEHETVPPE